MGMILIEYSEKREAADEQFFPFITQYFTTPIDIRRQFKGISLLN
jgi:hypothetical protein